MPVLDIKNYLEGRYATIITESLLTCNISEKY